MNPSSNSIHAEFFEDELLYRAVRPSYLRNGRLSSAAFKDKNGLSVERGYHRPSKACVDNMRSFSKLEGSIYSVSIENCKIAKAYVRYCPTKNLFHSEIHGSETEITLDDAQALILSRSAKFVCK